MTSRERVKCAFAQVEPDFPPCDYFATPEIHQALLGHFKIKNEAELRSILGVDIRYINPPYIGPPLARFDDGSEMNIFGIRKKPMANEYGDYAEAVNLPYADWQSVEEAEKFPWPDPDWFDYEAVPELCRGYPGLAIATGAFAVQDFINNVAYGRGVEQVFIDIAMENPVYLYLVEKRHRFYLEVIERTLKEAEGMIDFVLCGDDFGSQRGLLISPKSFDCLFADKKKEFFDMVHSHNATVSHHCCGSSVELIPRFIEIGMDALQTIQPQAAGMNPYKLKSEFRGKITLHGAVDVQGWLQKADCLEIEKEVFHLLEEVGAGGGFIISPSHNIQPDTPLEKALAIYRSIAKYQGAAILE